MSKLDEIKNALAEYEAAVKKADKFAEDHPQKAKDHITLVWDIVEDDDYNLKSNAPDYLRALVDVAEAAAAIGEPLAIVDGQTKAECVYCGNRIYATVIENQHADDCTWLLLQKALKALD